MKITIMIGLIVGLLAGCSSLSNPTQLESLALPGAPGNSSTTFHTEGTATPNRHRATVVAKAVTTTYAPDTYIPTNAQFSVDLSAAHLQDLVRVSVSPNSWWNPILCSWNSGRYLTCSGSNAPLSFNTLYTVKVEEKSSITGLWSEVGKAYFRTY